MSRLYIYLLIFMGVVSGCETGLSGEEIENQPPKTYLTVKEINLSEDNRLSSQVNISWWGDDADGYIAGYEYAISDTSEGAWKYTTLTDSIFVLPITVGQATDDVLFKVRAVDNDGEKDPVGARVTFPIKNTVPTVQVVPTESAPDTTYSIASFGWVVGDPDGYVNINRTEIAFNDTSGVWTEIPLEGSDEVFIILEIDSEESKVYQGRSYRETGITVSGINLNGDNTFYVRTIDEAGAASEIDTVTWYVKEQTSDILFISDYTDSNSKKAEVFHKQKLSEIGINSYDSWDVSGGDFGLDGKVRLSGSLPNVIDPVLQRTMAQWKYIYWASNSLNRNLTYAQEMLQLFFSNGGMLFINAPSGRLASTDPLLNLLPIEKFTSYSGDDGRGDGPIILRNSEITPFHPSHPTLQITESPSNIYGFKVTSAATALYEADIKMRTISGIEEYDAPKTIALENPEGNIIYFGIDFQIVDGYNNVADLLDLFINEKLCFDGSCQ